MEEVSCSGRVLRVLPLAVCAAVVCLAGSAFAQRAGENAATAADDAFGTQVGNESIGLYGTHDARGFSPVQAGNARIEGLYFDQQAFVNERVQRGSTVRVGISAQSYAFPAPTGIADYNLRLPGEKQIVSAVASYGPFDSYGVEVDGQFPVVADKLSVGLGIGSTRYDNDVADKNRDWSVGVLARWRPADAVQVSGFYGHFEDCRNAQQPQIFTAGAYLPPRFPRRVFFGQTWTGGNCIDANGGLLARAALPDDWTLRAGVFRSYNRYSFFGDFLRAAQPDGTAQHSILSLPRQTFTAYSGEIRASKIVAEGPRRHTFDFAFRGRDVQRNFGGGDVRDFGIGFVGVRTPLPEPTFTYGPLTNDHTRQGTAGVAYGGIWAGVGEVGVGLQKTFYRREIAQPALPNAKRTASPLLYNTTANFLVTKELAVYAGYTRGLEESGAAPFSAANRGEAMPVSLTKQVDAGFRYAFTPRLRLVAGVFQVEKPYFNVNAANVFGPLGAVRHRGLEVSLAGQVIEGLSVVAGMVLLEPRISGDAVDRGIVGPIPVGPKPGNYLFNLQYFPPAWKGFGLDGQVGGTSSQMAHSDNLLKNPGSAYLNLGARYTFKLVEVPTSLRVQVQNVTNAFAWNVNSSGSFFPRSPRRLTASVTADF